MMNVLKLSFQIVLLKTIIFLFKIRNSKAEFPKFSFSLKKNNMSQSKINLNFLEQCNGPK